MHGKECPDDKIRSSQLSSFQNSLSKKSNKSKMPHPFISNLFSCWQRELVPDLQP